MYSHIETILHKTKTKTTTAVASVVSCSFLHYFEILSEKMSDEQKKKSMCSRLNVVDEGAVRTSCSASVDRISYSLYSPIYQVYREHEHTFAKTGVMYAYTRRRWLERIWHVLKAITFLFILAQQTPSHTDDYPRQATEMKTIIIAMNFVASKSDEYPVEIAVKSGQMR